MLTVMILSLVTASPSSAASIDARLAAMEVELASERALHTAAVVAAVVADAEQRSWDVGWSDGFAVRSQDGDFTLDLFGQIQVNAIFNHGPGTDDRSRFGFENRRTKLAFGGSIFDDIDYKIGGAFDRRSGEFELSDAWIGHKFGDYRVRLGRMRPWMLREDVVSSKRQALVDRSLVAKRFGLSRSVGVTVRRVEDTVRGEVSLQASDPDLAGKRNWRAVGRLDVLLVGDSWRPLRDSSSYSDRATVVAFGIAALIGEEDSGEGLALYTADITAESDGRHLTANWTLADDDDAARAWGAVVEAGFFVAPEWALTVRGTYGHESGVDDDLLVLTGGFVHFIHGHDLRVTMDVGYGFNAVADDWSSTAAGWREGDAGQIVVRSQLQLLF